MYIYGGWNLNDFYHLDMMTMVWTKLNLSNTPEPLCYPTMTLQDINHALLLEWKNRGSWILELFPEPKWKKCVHLDELKNCYQIHKIVNMPEFKEVWVIGAKKLYNNDFEYISKSIRIRYDVPPLVWLATLEAARGPRSILEEAKTIPRHLGTMVINMVEEEAAAKTEEKNFENDNVNSTEANVEPTTTQVMVKHITHCHILSFGYAAFGCRTRL